MKQSLEMDQPWKTFPVSKRIRVWIPRSHVNSEWLTHNSSLRRWRQVWVWVRDPASKKQTREQRRKIPGVDLGNPQAHAHIFAHHTHIHKKKQYFEKYFKKPNIKLNFVELPIDSKLLLEHYIVMTTSEWKLYTLIQMQTKCLLKKKAKYLEKIFWALPYNSGLKCTKLNCDLKG